MRIHKPIERISFNNKKLLVPEFFSIYKAIHIQCTYLILTWIFFFYYMPTILPFVSNVTTFLSQYTCIGFIIILGNISLTMCVTYMYMYIYICTAKVLHCTSIPFLFVILRYTGMLVFICIVYKCSAFQVSIQQWIYMVYSYSGTSL